MFFFLFFYYKILATSSDLKICNKRENNGKHAPQLCPSLAKQAMKEIPFTVTHVILVFIYTHTYIEVYLGDGYSFNRSRSVHTLT